MLLRIATWITGDDYSTVRSYDVNSRKKIISTAILIFIPVSLWFIIGWGLSFTFFEMSMLWSMVTGFGLSLFVYIIDSSIIQSNSNAWGKSFRIVMAIVMAVLGGVVIDSILFQNDIEKIISEKENEENPAIAKLQAEQSTMYEELQQQGIVVQIAQENRDNSLEAYLAEIDGSGGSNSSGVGPIAEEKKKIAESFEATLAEEKVIYSELKNDYQSFEESLIALAADNSAMNSITHRIIALHEHVFSNWFSAIFYIFTFVFLLFLEAFIVVTKWTSKPSNYEKDLQLYDTIEDEKRKLVA